MGLIVAAVLFALSACVPMVAPPGMEHGGSAVTDTAFITHDGLVLPMRHWDAAHPVAVIAALHGMSDYSEAFDMPGPWWAQHGISVYAYDQRGFGASPNAWLWAGSETMRHDLDDFVEALHEKYPGLPIYALGESMGGAVLLSALADNPPPRIDGAILVAPAVWSRSDMPMSYRMALWLGAHTLPWVHLSGEGLKIWPSDNIPMLRALSHDPLYQHDARIDQLSGLVDLMDQAHEAPARMPANPPPILLLYGDKDQVIPRAPTLATIATLGSRASVKEYPNGYHMLLRDLDGQKRWADIATWIESTSAAKTSHTEAQQSPP